MVWRVILIIGLAATLALGGIGVYYYQLPYERASRITCPTRAQFQDPLFGGPNECTKHFARVYHHDDALI